MVVVVANENHPQKRVCMLVLRVMGDGGGRRVQPPLRTSVDGSFLGGGRSGDVAKEPPPSRMSIRGSFSRVGGGDVAKEPPLSKTSIRGSFSRVVVVVMLPKSNHPQKRAVYARFRGWWWWWRWWAMEKHPSNLWVVKSMLVST